tara:strand:- start:109 stop:747 length:639 start_codon:yes stop_codon:yes gene_type:complete
MFVDDEKEIIFVHNPKAAGSSIHILLKDLYELRDTDRYDPEPHIHHMNYQQILNIKPDYHRYYSFAAVRNPWSRLLSGYMDFTQNRKHEYSGLIRYDEPLLSEYRDFKDFVMRIGEGKWINDVHFLPQHVYTHAEDKVVDMIMRVENLNMDVHALMNKLGFKHYQHLFGARCQIHRATKHGHYTEYYDEQSAAKVAELYAKDIELFGYRYGE